MTKTLVPNSQLYIHNPNYSNSIGCFRYYEVGKSFIFGEFMHFAVHSIVNSKIIIIKKHLFTEANVQLYKAFRLMHHKTLVPNSQLYINNP